MNSRNLLLASILLNVSLLAGFAWHINRAPVAADAKPAPASATAAAPAGPAKRGSATGTEPAPMAPAARAEAFNWRNVESEDYKKYIANLRAIGCPEETIKDIIIADVNKLYAPKLAALNRPATEYKYWEPQRNYPVGMDKDKQRQMREIAKEKKALLQELLSVDSEEEARKLYGGTDYYERMSGFLPKEKREGVRELVQKFSELEQDVYRKSDGRPDSEDSKELLKIRNERRAELAKLLTPQELLDYELRSSQTASQMRYDLTAFEPNEDEFRRIFKARAEFDNEFGPNYGGTQDAEQQKKRAEAQRKVDEALKLELGPERYAEYKQASDYAYRELARVATRYELPKETAKKVWAVKTAAEEQASKLRQDQSLSTEQRQAAAKAIQAETEKAVTEMLGERGYKSYVNSGGYWVRNVGSGVGVRRVVSP
ncbi:MAG: hypothetical protein FD161_3128 [Limisphaerales bacterium]|nr:MAG: hypothetical protein FD161_3128 [Limisphaerales bacterium]KAG0508037.1 MAG: hypothetical protein E1N63_2835 [Limisphaerales bacterium]TXT50428.1 MAG: hypothetical protein FD140_2351 [Limisphaerales bacterium]